MVMSANNGTFGETGEISYPPGAIVLALVGYFTVTFVGLFFNSALIHAANERIEGGDPSVGSALRGAWGRVGRILAFLAGTAWAVVTFLVLPVIIIENRGPVASVQRSASLLKRPWGEGLGIVNALIFSPAPIDYSEPQDWSKLPNAWDGRTQ